MYLFYIKLHSWSSKINFSNIKDEKLAAPKNCEKMLYFLQWRQRMEKIQITLIWHENDAFEHFFYCKYERTTCWNQNNSWLKMYEPALKYRSFLNQIYTSQSPKWRQILHFFMHVYMYVISTFCKYTIINFGKHSLYKDESHRVILWKTFTVMKMQNSRHSLP